MAVFSSGHLPAPAHCVGRESSARLLQAVDRIRDLLCSFEARLHGDFPSVVEGIAGELLFALKMT